MRDWPLSERPRERLFRFGVQALSNAELLTLFLRSGTRGENARDLAIRILESSHGLRGLAQRPPQELLQITGLGPAKVATLIAALEIGNRILAERIEHRPLIGSAQDLFDLLRHSFTHEREELFSGVLLNARNEVVKTLPLSRGDPTQTIISIPQVIRRLLMEGTAAVIFVHNHPSGDPAPSEADKGLTRRLVQACQTVEITMHDHLILGDQMFFSFAQEGLL